MKKLFSLLVALLLTASVFAQAPEKMSYQAVIRDASNHLVSSENVGMQVSILQGSGTGTEVFIEIYNPNPQTNANGLVTIEIGSGIPVTGTFSAIDWANGPYFIKTETDPTGGTNYTISGTSQLLSVPYALLAKTAESDAATKANLDLLKAQIAELQGVKDIDNNRYDIVTIGTQVWMAENLRVTRYNDGTAIPLVTDATAWSSLFSPAFTWYDNNAPMYNSAYGALYNYYSVADTNSLNVCPIGWHVPTDAEWTILSDALGGFSVAGGKMKETGFEHWGNPNTGATNESSFAGLPGGYRGGVGTFFYNIGYLGYWWCSTEAGAGDAGSRLLVYNSDDLSRDSNYASLGFSVRCLRD